MSDVDSTHEAPPKRARDKIFEVAADMFYREGIRAVGVEAIVKKAGVTKISLYRSFPSKDDLVVAYLEDRRRTFLSKWDEMSDRYRDDPNAQLRAIMTYLADRTTTEGYRGCPFINFCAEFPDPDHPGRQVARARSPSSPVRSTMPALTTRPPSSIRCRVLLRRSTCHVRMSCRARAAGCRLRAARLRRSAASVAVRCRRRSAATGLERAPYRASPMPPSGMNPTSAAGSPTLPDGGRAASSISMTSDSEDFAARIAAAADNDAPPEEE